jgi:hypothetical protein
MGRFDNVLDDPVTQSIGAIHRGFQMGVESARQEKKLKLQRKQFGAKEAKSRIESEYATRIFQVKDEIISKEVGAHRYKFNEFAAIVESREAKKALRSNWMEKAWERNEKAPIVRDIDGDVPIFERDIKDKPKMVTREEYEKRLQSPGYVDPIDNPAFERLEPFEGEDYVEALGGYEADPKNPKYRSTAELLNEISERRTSIEALKANRDVLRLQEAKRLNLDDPRDIGLFNNSLVKNPTIDQFLKQVPSRSNFDGMSENQKDSLLTSIDQMGGLQNSIKYAAALGKMNHAKWLAQWYPTVTVREGNQYDFSNIPEAYIRNPDLGREKLAKRRMEKRTNIARKKIEQDLRGKTDEEKDRLKPDWLKAIEATEEAAVEAVVEVPPNATEEQIRAAHKKAMTRKQYKKWLEKRKFQQKMGFGEFSTGDLNLEPSKTRNLDTTLQDPNAPIRRYR